MVMPPLGEFMEGGLLLLTREHILSLAHLPPSRFDHLERLLKAIQHVLVKHWGVTPLIFEHGPAPDDGKGVCCVDHAHLNIFPAPVSVHPHLAQRMNFPLATLSELGQTPPRGIRLSLRPGKRRRPPRLRRPECAHAVGAAHHHLPAWPARTMALARLHRTGRVAGHLSHVARPDQVMSGKPSDLDNTAERFMRAAGSRQSPPAGMPVPAPGIKRWKIRLAT